MTSLDAVAAAIRERLLGGQPAPLLGLGTLVRQHVAARIEERADGTRVMLPPGETIGLDPTATREPSLAQPFARLLAVVPGDAERAYADAMDQIEARLAATGEVRLPGVGLLRRTSGGVVLGVEAELLAAVNRRYEGLSAVETPSTTAAASPVVTPPPAAPVPSAPPPASVTPPAVPEPDVQPEQEARSEPTPPPPPPPTPDPFGSAQPGPTTPPEPRPQPLGPTTPEPEPPVTGAPDAPPPDAPPPDPFGAAPESDAARPQTRPSSDRAEADAPTAPAADSDATSGALRDLSSDGERAPFSPTIDADATPDLPPSWGLPAIEVVPPSGRTEPQRDAEVPAQEPVEEPVPHHESRPSGALSDASDDASSDTPTDDAPADVPPGGFDEPQVAAPFGGPDAPPLADVISPTPQDRQPDEPSAPHLAPDDEWARDTWTAPSLGGPISSLDAPSDGTLDADMLDAVIEDADFDVVEPEPTATAPSPEATAPDWDGPASGDSPSDDAPWDGSDDDLPHVVVPSSPATLTSAVPAGSPAVLVPSEPVPLAAEPEAHPVGAQLEAGEPERRWWLWALLLLLLALAVAAAIWFWPQIDARLGGDALAPGETITVDAAPRRTALTPPTPPASVAAPGDTALAAGALAATAAGTYRDGDAFADAGPADVATGTAPRAAPTPTARPTTARDDDTPAPRTGLGQAPAPGVALLPPRVSGLSRTDVRALTARDEPITPDADAWTLVVLSTPSRDDAEALRERYRRAGYRTAVLTSRGGQFRVAVGQFDSRDAALRLLDRLPPQAPADTWPLDLQSL